MKALTRQSIDRWVTLGLIALSAFTLFGTGLVFVRIASGRPAVPETVTIVGLVGGSLLAAMLTSSLQRRFPQPTAAAAAWDGALLALVVIVANSLLGWERSAIVRSVQSASLLTCLPALMVLAFFLTRRRARRQ